jgi:hypothetical protein
MLLSEFKKGMTVYDVGYTRTSNRAPKVAQAWEVEILDIDLHRRAVLAKWNGQPARNYYEHSWVRWRKEKPATVQSNIA